MKTSSLLVFLVALLCAGCQTAKVRKAGENLPAGSVMIVNKTPFFLELSDGASGVDNHPPVGSPAWWRIVIHPRETRVLKDFGPDKRPAAVGIRAFEIERIGCVALPHSMGNYVRPLRPRDDLNAEVLTVHRWDLR